MIGAGSSGSGGGTGGVPGGGCGVGPWAERTGRISVSEIGAPPVVFPIAVAGRLRSLRAADLARFWQGRWRRLGRVGAGKLGRILRLFVHSPNMGPDLCGSTCHRALNERAFSL